MKKFLTTTALVVSLCAGAVFPASAENTTGIIKAWSYMQADGWKSADGMNQHPAQHALSGHGD